MKKIFSCLLVFVMLLSGCALGADSEQVSSVNIDSSSSTPEISSVIAPSSTPQSVSSTATSGTQQDTFTLVVPEGYTLARIGLTLEEMGICTTDEWIAATQEGDYSAYSLIAEITPDVNRCFTLEGYLFPATYEFATTASIDDIIRTMLNTTEQRIDESLHAQIAASGYTVNEILALASMIEKESFGVEVMPMVSSVFHNRLDQGMQLQSDVTINYVEGAIKPFITGDVDRYNDYYNTYTTPALPAGPICNPGISAIQAAVAPAQTDYLFFVTDMNKEFYFEASYDAHLANIDEIKAAGLWE